jgi:murein DD-endopeptidase MepM/ murein hydrolase activator NlpD
MWNHKKRLLSGKMLMIAVIFIGTAGLLGASCTRFLGVNNKAVAATYEPDRIRDTEITPSLSVGVEKFRTVTPETPGSESVLIESTSTPSITVTPELEKSTSTHDFISPICSPLKNLSFTDLQAIISQTYNVTNPYSDFGHHGVDLGSYNFYGQYMYEWPVQAVLYGKVAGTIEDRPPLGNAVIIETPQEMLPIEIKEALQITPGESIYHMYAHLLLEPDIKPGQEVHCGDVIGQLGKSQTVEAHLHLEMRIGASGRRIPGMAFYDASTTEEERQTYLWWRTSGDFMPFDPMIFLSYLDAENYSP